ncbi:MAG: cyclic nucleotide-binding domain-containing protein [candidate division Zixibacteria bacterium]|nr:cyclic nucleotide-binding domain-containing protein [candidate division Zixibacteria bacterium]
MFSYLSPDELKEVQGLFQEEIFNKGDTICRIGEEGNTFYVVVAGLLEVWVGPKEDILVARLGPGDFFGELALVLGGPRSATVMVEQRTRLLSLSKEVFNRFLLKNTKVLEYFSRVMCQRLAASASGASLKQSSTEITVISRPGLKGKTLVANALASLLKTIGKKRVLLVTAEVAGSGTSLPEDKQLLRELVTGSPEKLQAEVVSVEGQPAKLKVWVDPNASRATYGEVFSSLIERLNTDFEYFVIDLGSEPQSLINSIQDFSDKVVRIVDRAASGENGHGGGDSDEEKSVFNVVNLFNKESVPVPINHCEPYVLPNVGSLSAGDVDQVVGSALGVPLKRLARKILGRTVGLAFGGGAAFGLAHIGVIKVLEENDIPIDIVSGCSMGSIIACGYAAGVTTDQLIEMAHDLGIRSKLIKVVDPTLTRPGFLGGDRIKTVLAPYLGARQTFKDLVLPCRIIATDIVTGERVEIGTGRLEDAFRASSSVPVVLAPVKQGEHVLVDGGVCDPVPAETLRHMGADINIAINVVPPPKRGVEMILSKLYRQFNPLTYLGMNEDIPNMFDITMAAMQILQYELGNFKAISADVRINPDVSDFTWVDFGRSEEIIARGVEATERVMPTIKRVMAEHS